MKTIASDRSNFLLQLSFTHIGSTGMDDIDHLLVHDLKISWALVEQSTNDLQIVF